MDPLLLDNFIGVNGTALSAHVPNAGGPWIDDAVGWQIQGNAAKQTANGNTSHVEAGSKICIAAAVVNVHLADANNSVLMQIGNDAGDASAFMGLSQNGSVRCVLNIPVSGNVWETDISLPGSFDPTLNHLLQINYGPDLTAFLLDGQLQAMGPRQNPKSFIPTRFSITGSLLNAATGVSVKQVFLGF